MALDSEFIGHRIQNIRKQNGLTQCKFAERIHITQQTLSRYENGKTPIPYEAIVDISVEFRVPLGYFFGIDTDEASEEEILLIEYYRKIDSHLKERVLNLVRTIAEDFSLRWDEGH